MLNFCFTVRFSALGLGLSRYTLSQVADKDYRDPLLSEHTIRPNKKNKFVSVTGLKILGRVGTNIFLIIFFSGKNIILCILKGEMPLKMHKIIFCPVRGFTNKFR